MKPATTIPELERDFQRYCVDFLTLNGWRLHHSLTVKTKLGHRTPISGSPGLPDIVATRGGRIAFLELKSDGGKLSDDQVAWVNALSGVDREAGFWNGRGFVPPHVTKGEPWDVLVGVVRPRWVDWFNATFATLGGLST